jgi:hypothetical protein
MSNSTDEFWDVEGQSLQTYAFNITTWGADRQAPPPLRGSDIIIPGAAGRVATSRQVDSRVITLAMWVQGSDENGNAPTSGSGRAQFERNWTMLRNLLWRRGRIFTLTKRFRVNGVGPLITASARARYAGGLAPAMGGTRRAAFTVDLELADPYFYGAEVTIPAFSSVSSQQTVNILGDDRTHAITVDISGARVNSKVKVTTPDADVISMNLSYSLGGSDKASLDVAKFVSRITPGSGSAFPAGGYVTHAGDPFWLALDPGSNKLEVSSTSGAGSIVIKYKPVYL